MTVLWISKSVPHTGALLSLLNLLKVCILLETRPRCFLSTICTLKTPHFLQVLLTSLLPYFFAKDEYCSRQYQIVAGLSDFRAVLQIVPLLTSPPWYNFVASYLLLPWSTARKFYYNEHIILCIVFIDWN